jgi:RNA polymerase subunit RPABC4/transcription elongation factor Spt4
MKLCFSCGRLTSGVPAYCHYCGKTYNVRLCSRGHINPRSANVCSQCGSKELSTPQRKIPFLLKPLIFLLSHLTGFLLIGLLVGFLGFFVYRLVLDPNGLLPLMCIGFFLGLLLLVWMSLPNFIRSPIRWLFRRKGHKK